LLTSTTPLPSQTSSMILFARFDRNTRPRPRTACQQVRARPTP
jgi:hypothetical protein